MPERYRNAPDADGLWKIVYVSTGEVVTIEGQPLNQLDEYEVREALRLLDAGELVPDLADGP